MADDLLRLRCSEIIDTLPVPRPFALEPLRRNLERHRPRQVRLVAALMPPGRDGCRIRIAEADCIFYRRDTGWRRQLQIIGHQIAHMMLGHQGMADADDGLSRILFPHLNPQTVQETLAVLVYTDAEEREADLFASLLLERIDGSPEPPPAVRQ